MGTVTEIQRNKQFLLRANYGLNTHQKLFFFFYSMAYYLKMHTWFET